MCGICGIYNFNGLPADKHIIESMNESMFFRGQ